MFSGFLRNVNAPKTFRHYLKHQHKRPSDITNNRNFRSTTCLQKKVAFKLSDIGEGIREVSIKEWYVKEGDVVEQFDNLCEVQSDKASVTITSRYDGKILKLYQKVDEVAKVGEVLIDFDVEDSKDSDDDEEEKAQTSSSESDSEADQSQNIVDDSKQRSEEITSRYITLATPAVRRIAREHNVDLSKVVATGKNGRVLKGDVLEHLGMIPPGTTVPHPTIAAKSVDVDTKTVPIPSDRIETLKGIRRIMLKTMTESLKIPHFAYSDEVEMTHLMEFRNQLRDVAKENGVPKLTFLPFCIKAASIALAKYPILNSSLNVEDETVIYKGAHNISVAIDTPLGLVVPNIKNCQLKNIIEIAKDLNGLIERGRKGVLTPVDFEGGTFSLSNIGAVGGTYTHPCIMAPQVAIGAMGRTKIVPRFNEKDELVKGHIMNISWCADHRVIDGVTMANFSNLWKKYLENPALFLLN